MKKTSKQLKNISGKIENSSRLVDRFHKTIKTKITVYFNLEKGIITMSPDFLEDDKYVSH